MHPGSGDGIHLEAGFVMVGIRTGVCVAGEPSGATKCDRGDEPTTCGLTNRLLMAHTRRKIVVLGRKAQRTVRSCYKSL